MNFKKLFSSLLIAIICCAPAFSVFAAGNIDAVQKYSQFLNIDLDSNGTNDFINWSPTNGGATVSNSTLTGYIWGETTGWINLNPTNSGVTNTCSGILGGYAWGQNTGWINFAPTNATGANQPKINITTGAITGSVWSQNYGWITLNSSDGTHPGLTTTWHGCTTTPGGGGGGGGGGSGSGGCPLPMVIINGTCQLPVNPPPPPWVPTPTPPPGNPPITPSNPPTPTPSNPGPTNGGYTPPVVTPVSNPPTSNPNAISGVSHGSIPLVPIENFAAGLLGGKPTSYGWLLPIVAFLGLLSSLPGLVTRFGNLILTIVFGRKKMRGIVYDSNSKEPLDPVYVSVIDLVTGKEIANQFTDIEGRFGFILKKGTYKIVTQKTHYQFPSIKLAGKMNDEVYDQLYFGETITVTDDDQVFVMNIPMDPLAKDWNQQEKHRKSFLRYLIDGQTKWNWLFNILFILGFAMSLVITYYYPVWWNVGMVILYVVITLVKILGYGPITAGKITRYGSPLAHAIVRVVNANLNREIAHKVTSDTGGYFILVPKGDYYVTIEMKNQDGTYTKIATSRTIHSQDGLINASFDL